MFASIFYRKSPIILQNTLISLRALTRKLIREGRTHKRLSLEIENSQFLSAADLLLWREASLGNLLSEAVLDVPFYRLLGLGPIVAEGCPFEALKAFPIIDKSTIRKAGGQFMSENSKRPLVKGSTSGTTGTPLTLYSDFSAVVRENAFIWRQLKWAGLREGERRAWIRGDLVVPSEVNTPPFWRVNGADNMLMFSSYHLSEKNALAYISALEQFNPVVIQAYPSSISFLAKWLQASDRAYSGAALRGIVTSSESLEIRDRQLVEKNFHCKVYDWYGQFERVAAIGTCERGQYHVVEDYSYVELIPEEGGPDRIIGTGFNNSSMPLIRYDTGDFAESGQNYQCACGRSFRTVAAVVGRKSDYIKLRDGRFVGRITAIFGGLPGILEAQIVQPELDQLIIYVVPDSNWSKDIGRRLIDRACRRTGGVIKIQVVLVTAIERTRNGKLRDVISFV